MVPDEVPEASAVKVVLKGASPLDWLAVRETERVSEGVILGTPLSEKN